MAIMVQSFYGYYYAGGKQLKNMIMIRHKIYDKIFFDDYNMHYNVVFFVCLFFDTM